MPSPFVSSTNNTENAHASSRLCAEGWPQRYMNMRRFKELNKWSFGTFSFLAGWHLSPPFRDAQSPSFVDDSPVTRCAENLPRGRWFRRWTHIASGSFLWTAIFSTLSSRQVLPWNMYGVSHPQGWDCKERHSGQSNKRPALSNHMTGPHAAWAADALLICQFTDQDCCKLQVLALHNPSNSTCMITCRCKHASKETRTHMISSTHTRTCSCVRKVMECNLQRPAKRHACALMQTQIRHDDVKQTIWPPHGSPIQCPVLTTLCMCSVRMSVHNVIKHVATFLSTTDPWTYCSKFIQQLWVLASSNIEHQIWQTLTPAFMACFVDVAELYSSVRQLPHPSISERQRLGQFKICSEDPSG